MTLYIGEGAHMHGHAHHGQEHTQGETTALTLAEEEAHRSPTLPHRTSSERHRLCFAPTTMARATRSTRSSFNTTTMAVEAPWSSHAPPTGLSLPLQPCPCSSTNPRHRSPLAGTLGSPSRHLDPTTALTEAWRCFCLP